MLKKILIGLAAVVTAIMAAAAVQPTEYHVERSAEIEAPAEIVWAEISDFNQWKAWNAWEKCDPNQKTTIEGLPGAVGHKSSWEGEKTGRGSMTIATATPPSHIAFKLHFLEPMDSTADSTIDLQPQGDGVKLTWAMDGKNNYVGKLFGLFMNMDEMIGSKYEESLADLKGIAETKAKEAAELKAKAAAEEEAAGEEAAGEKAAGEDAEAKTP